MGEFENYGVYRYKTGEVYEGFFKNGESHGFGKATFENGDIYEGNWENGTSHGNGTLIEKADQFTLAIGIWVKSMVMVFSISQRGTPMLVNLRMEDFMVSESTSNKMNDMKENGNMISDMGMG